jgi:predicted nucleic acid-binding protein
MAVFRNIAVIVAPNKTLSVSGDEPDNRFIECADAAQAEFLVTGNKRHFPTEWKTTRIVNSRELFNLIDLEK